MSQAAAPAAWQADDAALRGAGDARRLSPPSAPRRETAGHTRRIIMSAALLRLGKETFMWLS